MDQCNRIITASGITGDQEKKNQVLSYVTAKVRQAWEGVREYQDGTSYADWVIRLRKIYPEHEERTLGSLSRLREICKDAEGVTRGELGRILRFTTFFAAEAKKLIQKPAQVTNSNLVGTILDTVHPDFSAQIGLAMNNPGIETIWATDAEIAEDDAAILAAQPAGEEALVRRGDRLSWKKVLKIVEHLAENWTGTEALFSTTNGRNTMVPAIKIEPVILERKAESAMKREVTDKLEMFQLDIAALKDTLNVQDRRMNEVFRKFETVQAE
uniref:Uncharacterized protein n=1 Tax=Mycena chlorophos TaxID=658473 RepID=A0ABQ0LJF2_MYCCL|nr:predicted protein [Mycena chlorophos]